MGPETTTESNFAFEAFLPLGLIALLFFIDLRAKETSYQCAKCERNCEPNAKTHHCDGA